MRAVVIEKITVAGEIELTEVPIPKVKSGWVLIKVKAFGLNHSEQILRHQEIEAAYIQKPVIMLSMHFCCCLSALVAVSL